MEKSCTNCGSSDWNELFNKDYPEHRSDRDRTIQTVYECDECGAQGKRFEHNGGGPDIFSGAMG